MNKIKMWLWSKPRPHWEIVEATVKNTPLKKPGHWPAVHAKPRSDRYCGHVYLLTAQCFQRHQTLKSIFILHV